MTPSELGFMAAMLCMDKTAAMNGADFSKRIERHKELAMKFVKRRQMIGAGIGLGVGAGASALEAHVKNKDVKSKSKRRMNMAVNTLAGGALGAFAGHQIGGLTAMPRHVRNVNRSSSYVNDRTKWVNRSRAGGGQSADKGGGGHPFWDKVPEAVRNKVRGTAAHAKKTQGPEGETAKNVLRNQAKKHGFNYDDAIKHAGFRLAMQMSSVNVQG